MGNKKKVGKSRQDKFYKLAKESGFRARSAFKLLQLNRKFEFLQSSRVIIDLCAAPGGWLQVAAEHAPISSVIIGVDLVPIKPIRRVTTLVDDITSEKCRQDLRRELQTWKADCVLNDGAPNVGKNWVHDAFQQIQLTLHAVKLATEFLKKGGWFVTKVFRSKDYDSLLWVLRQLFKNVHATKPQASRNESAEIFVVCQHYLAPDKIDPKFLNPKHVFKDVEEESKPTLDLLHPEKKKRYREGYPEGDYTLFHTLKVSEYFASSKHMDLLADASEVVIDDKRVEDHPATTKEIKECLKDIKVLGKKEIRMIINWRKKLTKEFAEADKPDSDKEEKEEESEKSEDEIEKLEKQVEELKGSQQRELKRKIKKTRRERNKLQHKMDMKMILPGDNLELAEDRDMFDLNKIRNKKQLDVVDEGGMMEEEQEEIADKDDIPNKRKRVAFEKGDMEHLDDRYGSRDPDEDDSDIQFSDDDGDISMEEEDDDDDGNPLLVGRPSKKAKMDMWFSKDSFADIENEDDEDIEIGKMTEVYKRKGGVIKGKTSDEEDEEEKKKNSEKDELEVVPVKTTLDEDDSDSSDSESSSDSDSDEETKDFYKNQTQSKTAKNAKPEDGFEVVTQDMKLGPKGLALGTALVSSRKKRREVIESGYHRYMFNDENLPQWFVTDEMKHQRVNLPVTKGAIQEYKFKMKAVDANPIKKVAEAKARKKKKEMKRLERARKKAETINESVETSEREKWQQIKQVYKKAGLLTSKKKDIKYVVAKRGLAGKRAVRPGGVTGPYKQVDGRMKKDNRKMKMSAKQSKKGRGKGKGGKGGAKGRKK